MNTKRKTGLLISAIALVILVIGGIWIIKSPVGYLSMDINPSVEMSFNRFNKVVEIKGVNADGEALIEGRDLKGQEVDKVVEEIVEALLEKGYLTAENAQLLFSVDNSDSSRALLTRLNYQVVYWLKEYYEKTDVISQAVPLSREDRAKADKLGISYGRYAILKELFDDLDVMDLDNLGGLTLSDLLAYARENNIPLSHLIEDWNDDWDDMDEDDDLDDDQDDDSDDDLDDDQDDDNDDDYDDDQGDDNNDDYDDDYDDDSDDDFDDDQDDDNDDDYDDDYDDDSDDDYDDENDDD